MPVIDNIIEIIQQQGVLPLYYDDDEQTSVEVLKALSRAGCSAIEYTNRGVNAHQNFKVLKQFCKEELPHMQVGIGTIKNGQEAKLFAAAGADFIVCPGMVPAVANVAKEYGIAWVPGCLTPTEIILAEEYKARLVKLFPGSLLGASYVSAIKEIFPQLLFMPTGGVEVTEENIGAWFAAGVCAVGLGSKVISKDVLNRKDYAAIEVKTKEAIEIVKRLRR